MKITSHWPGAIKHIVALVLGWFVFSVLLGLFYAFQMMEVSKEVTASLAIPEVLKVATITFLVGLFVLSLPILVLMWLIKGNSDKRE